MEGTENTQRDQFGNLLQRNSHNVALFSLEMSAEQLALRILGEQAEVPSDEIRREEVAGHDVGTLAPGSPPGKGGDKCSEEDAGEDGRHGLGICEWGVGLSRQRLIQQGLR